jgi:glycine cleavage system aminomethyltransferase T
VSLEFLSPGAPASPGGSSPASPRAVARSPMERQARAAGARFEVRDGWNVAVSYAGEADALRAVGFADASHIRKYEVQDALPTLELGRATVDGDATWLPMTRSRALVLGGAPPAGALDVTTGFAALRLAGPLARETFARFTAIDLRPQQARLGDWRPGSVARTPGGILCEAEDRYLMLFGAALGQYMWTVVADAAGHLGGGPVGHDALVRGEAGDEPSASGDERSEADEAGVAGA